MEVLNKTAGRPMAGAIGAAACASPMGAAAPGMATPAGIHCRTS